MLAMRLDSRRGILRAAQVSRPSPDDDQILLKVLACGVCRTDLHIVHGELPRPKRPLIPGHEIVGVVEAAGRRVHHLKAGDRVGVPWLGRTCGRCRWCRAERENLCDRPTFTGYTLNGGYAEFAVADARYCFRIPKLYSSAEAAPLLCAGLIGYRALRMTGSARRLGLYGFGAAAHIVLQVARWQFRKIFVFTRARDRSSQNFARKMGAHWAGASDSKPPEPLDAAIIFAPVGSLVPKALRAVDKGGTVVCAGIHMSDIPSFPYSILWEERSVISVANLTRRDGEEFFKIAPKVPVRTHVNEFPLSSANEALEMLRRGKFQGAAVLMPSNLVNLKEPRAAGLQLNSHGRNRPKIRRRRIKRPYFPI